MSAQQTEQSPFRRIRSAEVVGAHRLRLVFDDGASGILDMAELVPFEGVFAAFRDPDFFRRVRVESGTIAWPNDVDFDPNVLHERVTGQPDRVHGTSSSPTPPPPTLGTERHSVPEISCFFGIVIRMRFNEHPKPHFHAEYAGADSVWAIETLEQMRGRPSPRVTGLVAEWAALHRAELLENWERLRRGQAAEKIAPLS